jgi:CHAD domain-containing protein
VVATHRELVADDSRPRDPAWVAEILGTRFTVRRDRPTTVRSVWLDSFDWRLHDAGIAAHQVRRGTVGELVLEDRSGDAPLTQEVRVSWPAMSDDLPESPVRDRLEPILGLRALLPLAETTARCVGMTLLDAEGQTVVRVAVEDARTTGAKASELPYRVVLTAVRGYERELARATKLLCAQSGVQEAAVSLRETALASVALIPGGYAGKPAVTLEASTPALQSITAILTRFADLVEANVSGVIDDVDTEFLHDLRVGVRGTRAMLKAVGDVLPLDIVSTFGEEWRWLGGVTTPVRDLDVFLLGLDGRSDELDVEGMTGLEPLRAHVEQQRRAAFRRLRHDLRSPRFTELMRDWRAALAQANMTDPPGISTGDLAVQRLRRAHRRVSKRASAISDDSSLDDLHTIRKRCKELRYLLEVFASLQDSKQHRRVIKKLKLLQNYLGKVQDSRVHLQELAGFVDGKTAKSLPPTSLLAVGALMDRLTKTQQEAKAELTGRLSRFAGRKQKAKVKDLIETIRG